MTQDVDIGSPRPMELAEEIAGFLQLPFHIAVRIRETKKASDIASISAKRQNRHLVDVRRVSELPPRKRVKKVLVVTPPELIAHKVTAWWTSSVNPRHGSDRRDLCRLLLTFPELKTEEGPVAERLRAARLAEVLAAWKDLVAQEILPEDDAEEL